ncbi:hypothetical protein FQN57_000337, partial [Myotisia sp. PD_48]
MRRQGLDSKVSEKKTELSQQRSIELDSRINGKKMSVEEKEDEVGDGDEDEARGQEEEAEERE